MLVSVLDLAESDTKLLAGKKPTVASNKCTIVVHNRKAVWQVVVSPQIREKHIYI